MTTKKVLVLSDDEVTIMMNCGKLLREIVDGVTNGTIDELAQGTISLISAIEQMAHETVASAATVEGEAN